MTAQPRSQVELLNLAEQILDGTVPVPGGKSARAAAIVARQSLEEAITARCAELATFLQRPNTRSQLILLRHDDSDTGRKAQVAWHGLSQACHHHAYELQPTTAEVRSLLGLVADIEAALTAGNHQGLSG